MPSPRNKLCISLLPESNEQLKEWMPDLQDIDLVEVRIDHIPKTNIKTIRTLTEKPLIITLRSEKEGGFWKGDKGDYLKILRSAINAGVDFIDVEFKLAKEVLPKLKPGSTQIILSQHTESTNSSLLKTQFEEMLTVNADVYKLIFTAETLRDNITALELIDFAKSKGVKYVIHAMGDAGEISRITGAVKGNEWTFVAREFNEETASGQLSFREAKNYYFLPQKTFAPRLFGLIGSPIQQSRGWRLHNRLIQEKIDQKAIEKSSNLLYVNFPAEHLDEFWLDWKNHIHGLSVTIPYKEKIIKHLTKVSTEVRISGVCNTVIKDGEHWIGYNTDLIAIEMLLQPFKEMLKNGGLIVGTGATARSAIAALKRLNVNPIFVVGRNSERGKMLANVFGVDYLQEDEVHYASASAILQTTPVGMVPYTDQYPLGTSLFRKDRVVLDVIYNPPETRFLKIARERGCSTISGEEMFVLQATKQFELFTGVPATLAEVKKIWQAVK